MRRQHCQVSPGAHQHTEPAGQQVRIGILCAHSRNNYSAATRGMNNGVCTLVTRALYNRGLPNAHQDRSSRMLTNRFRRRFVLALILSFSARALAQQKVDLGTITRIRYEGFRDSKIMELAGGLMDAIGERLTGSPNLKRANQWTRDELASFGLTN